MTRGRYDITPSARRLTTSLRDIGYDFTTAIADLVDNSISADATRVSIVIEHSGERSWLLVADDGRGMTDGGVTEALRFGSRREYAEHDLGRFGLGLKTASLSVGRKMTVVSRRAPVNRCITRRSLDLDLIRRLDTWRVGDEIGDEGPISEADRFVADRPGTVVVLEKLDRVFEGIDAASGWGRRRLEKLGRDLETYLGMVFHRFLEASASGGPAICVEINGSPVQPWNPFAPDEPATRQLEPVRYELTDSSGQSRSVVLRRFILPPRSQFSSAEAFERMSGLLKWNRQQGLYLYRGQRLVQAGNWSGLRGVDEHTKLARAALEFPTALDEHFKINVAKMRAEIPSTLKEMIARPINELCALAESAYRRTSSNHRRLDTRTNGSPPDLRSVGTALRVAAALSDQAVPLEVIGRSLHEVDSGMADALGF